MVDVEKNKSSKLNRRHHINWKILAAIAFAVIPITTILGILSYGTNTKTQASFIITYPNNYEEQTPEALYHRINYLLDELPEFSNINCSAIFAGNENETEKAKQWKIPSFELVWKQIEESDDQCKALKQSFVFLDHSLSPEETDYPIAYGALVYKDVEQVTYMLSSIYRPNNVYVFMVDLKASNDFKRRILFFRQCFPNIHVQYTDVPVTWGEHEIANAIYQSLRILTKSKYEWKYFQYISGFSMPLKTNLEMIRIFKQLNRSVDLHIAKFNPKRLSWANYGRVVKGTPKNESDSPLPLFITNLAAVFTRETAEAMIDSEKVEKLMKFLETTVNSDETMWGTILGNPDILEIPGGFNGSAILERIEEQEEEDRRFNPYGDPNKTRPDEYTFVPSQYYISRYHIWEGKDQAIYCKGQIVQYSCVFGVGDLPILITRPELVAHKLYFNFEPAAYFCLYQNHWKRTLNLNAQQNFNATPYSHLAMVQATRGISINNISFFYM